MTMHTITPAESKLLDLLRTHARASVADLARQLGLARATVQERLRRLEEGGVIEGYTVRLDPRYSGSRVNAHTLVRINAKQAEAFYALLKTMPHVMGIYTLSGEYDAQVVLQADSTGQLDDTLDAIGRHDAVERTQTSIVLGVKFER
jgi:DNA-binding Lrp family transcriptional regulator